MENKLESGTTVKGPDASVSFIAFEEIVQLYVGH